MIPSTDTFTLPLYRAYSFILGQMRYAWLVLALLTTLISMPAPEFRLPPITMPVASLSHAALPVAQHPSSDTTPVVPASPAAAPSASAATPQDCVTPAYGSPAPINLSDQSTGLTQNIDATTYYKIYGNTTAQIKAQLLQCAPPSGSAAEVGSFAAETGGTLSWQYDATADYAGVCTISNVKVGLHVNMILPAWQPTGPAASGLAANWQNLIDNLTIHENGHVALYQQYANRLVGDLQSLSGASCSAVADSVVATAAADISLLNAANASYDTATNHGVKQGAVLR